MSDFSIRVNNISKRYRLGLKEKQSETLVGQIGNIIKSPWENLKRLRELSHFGKEDDSIFWALKDVSFEVKKGEVLGIIGKNGAGKSTLLKILSLITEPTSGKIEIYGRVASLLEVGTGFHPELSGRENIFMNGTILGMTRREIDSKLDEIISFSGVEKFIDTPVKFYSSGMKVRLGFSVAAHLDPEILIIDEVLAVGDYEFQKKCLGKMEDVSKNLGRTVLFVSHDLNAIESLCENCVRIDNGEIIDSGNTKNVIENYLNTKPKDLKVEKNDFAWVKSFWLSDLNDCKIQMSYLRENWIFNIMLNVECDIDDIIVAVGIVTSKNEPISTTWSEKLELSKGEYLFQFINDNIKLTVGNYFLCIGISRRGNVIQYLENIYSLEIKQKIYNIYNKNTYGFLSNDLRISFRKY